MQRSLLLVTLLAVAGVLATVARPVMMYVRMNRAEHFAAVALRTLADAQRAFRSSGGAGGYATELASLTIPCPGQTVAALTLDPRLGSQANGSQGYILQLRQARQAVQVGTDCHGRPTASDYYAAVRPATELAGRQALAATSRGRIYLFFDGIPPAEDDMGAGGLAVPLERLPSFKIP